MVTDITNRLSVPVSTVSVRNQSVRNESVEQVAGSNIRQISAVDGQSVSRTEAAKEVQSQTPSASPLSEAVSNINSYVQNISRDLRFSVDETTDRVVVKVLDSETEELIREIPSEEALALARFLSEQREADTPQLEGLIIQVQA